MLAKMYRRVSFDHSRAEDARNYAILTDDSDFAKFYHSKACQDQDEQIMNILSGQNKTSYFRLVPTSRALEAFCYRDSSLLFLLLMLGTGKPPG